MKASERIWVLAEQGARCEWTIELKETEDIVCSSFSGFIGRPQLSL